MIKVGTIEITRQYEGVKFNDPNLSDHDKQFIMKYMYSSPSKSFAKFDFAENKMLLQLLSLDHTTHNVTIAYVITEFSEGILGMADSIVDQVDKIGNFLHGYKFPTMEETIADFSKYSGLESLLFALLTSKPVIIIDTDETVRRRVNNQIISLLAKTDINLLKNKTFLTYAEEIEDVAVCGIEEFTDEFDETMTVIIPEKKTILGNYDSPLTFEMADLLRNGNLAKLKEIILRMNNMKYDKSQHYADRELITSYSSKA